MNKDYNWWAEFYRNKGFNPIPKEPGESKKPIFKKWGHLRDKQCPDNIFKEWIKKDLFRNGIILCTGKASNNLETIDIDDKNLIEKLGIDLEKLIQEGFWIEETPRGYHIFYIHKGKCDREQKVKGLERKTNKCTIVTYPTPGYKLLNPHTGTHILPPPIHIDGDTLWEQLTKKLNTPLKKNPGIPTKKTTKTHQPNCITRIQEGVTKGERNNATVIYASHNKQHGRTEDETLGILKAWNKKNKPPLEEHILNDKARYVYRSSIEYGCNGIQNLGLCIHPETCPINKRNKEQEQQKKQGQQNIIKGYGGIYEGLVIEPLGDNKYVYNHNGEKGIATATYSETYKNYYLEIEGKKYFFDRSTPPLKKILFRIPSQGSLKKYITGEYEVKNSQVIYEEIFKFFMVLYDVKPVHYYHLIVIAMLQSWILPILYAVFYLFFTARYGGGKTVFLEGLSILSHHGFMAGNISPSALARAVNRQQLSIFADEFDVKAKSKDSEEYLVFRQGYKRNNPYVRSKETKNGYEEEIIDVFGFKSASVHGNIEKALQSRGVDIPLRMSKDNTLPILNFYKEELSSPIFEDLFFWYMDNIGNLVAHVSSVSLLSPVFEGNSKDFDAIATRKKLFAEITKDFTTQEIAILTKFFGRNEELLFIAMMVCKSFDIKKLDILETAFVKKKDSDESYSDSYLMETMKELLIKIYEEKKDNDHYILKKGEHENCFMYPKTEFENDYRIELKNNDIHGIRPDDIKDYLTELDFNEGINIKKERFGDKTKKALIFDTFVLRTLGLIDSLDDFNTNKEGEE